MAKNTTNSLKSKMSFWSLVRRFFGPLKNNPRLYAMACIPYTIRTITPLVTVLLMRYITNAIEQGDRQQFIFLLCLFVGSVFFLQGTKLLTRNIGRIDMESRGEKDIYPSYIEKFLTLDNTYTEKMGTGKLVSIMERGFSAWNRLLVELFRRGNAVVFGFIFVSVLIISLGRWYFLGFYALLFLVHFVLYKINKQTIPMRDLANAKRNEFSRSLVRIIMAKHEILYSGKTDYEIEKLNEHIQDMYAATKQRATNIQLMFSLPEMTLSTVTVVVFAVLGFGIFAKTYSYTDLVTFAGALALMDGVIDKSVRLFTTFAKEVPLLQRLRDVFDTAPTMQGYTQGKEFSYKKGDIDLVDVSFSYDEKKVFDRFSLSLQGGKKTAFVGISGSGKTTLLKLLAGYIKPDEGKIMVDGQPLANPQPLYQGIHVLPDKGGARRAEGLHTTISLQSYYHHIGYLTQDPSVFDGTIRENLIYALNGKPSEEQVKLAIAHAQCSFVYDFPDGVQTYIGERGVRLSGGQKQRLAIAKLFLKNPSIILLDEPTSALDSFSEEEVRKAFDALFIHRTVVIVAHRLQTVKTADDIVVIDAGKIKERGTHQELLRKGGYYKKMLDLQSGF